jgi:hypothetical protein
MWLIKKKKKKKKNSGTRSQANSESQVIPKRINLEKKKKNSGTRSQANSESQVIPKRFATVSWRLISTASTIHHATNVQGHIAALPYIYRYTYLLQ